jgi:hypothetical protein
MALIALTSLTQLSAQPSLEQIAQKEWADRPRPREEQQENAAMRAEAAKEKESAVRSSYEEALKRTRWERHDPAWWSQRYQRIVLPNGGYYYLDGGYWFPARGFDETNETYSYDGPIYAYDNLAPDQVITDVQARLRQGGYYVGAISGVLDPITRTAVAKFQREHDLPPTSAADEATVKALALTQRQAPTD